MPYTTRLILVRHGETLANREFRYIGARDDLLSQQGEAQAQQLAEALSILPVAAVYSSPRLRTVATAAPIAARHNLKVQKTSALREGSFGEWEGLTRTEVLTRSSLDEQRLHEWEADPRVAPPGGESFAEVQQRVSEEIERLAALHREQTIALVSHVGPIKVLLCCALGAPLSTLYNIFLDPATISVVDWRLPHPTLRLLNSHAHMGWERARWM